MKNEIFLWDIIPIYPEEPDNRAREKTMNKIEIYQTADDQTEVTVQFAEETVWLNQGQLA